jgi:hypothetical protein
MTKTACVALVVASILAYVNGECANGEFVKFDVLLDEVGTVCSHYVLCVFSLQWPRKVHQLRHVHLQPQLAGC